MKTKLVSPRVLGNRNVNFQPEIWDCSKTRKNQDLYGFTLHDSIPNVIYLNTSQRTKNSDLLYIQKCTLKIHIQKLPVLPKVNVFTPDNLCQRKIDFQKVHFLLTRLPGRS